jgi:hypothetical protein
MGVAALILRVVAVVGQLCGYFIVRTVSTVIVHTIKQLNLDFLVVSQRRRTVEAINKQLERRRFVVARQKAFVETIESPSRCFDPIFQLDPKLFLARTTAFASDPATPKLVIHQTSVSVEREHSV